MRASDDGAGSRPVSQASASTYLYTSESVNSRPFRAAGSVPATAARKFSTHPARSSHSSQCGMIASRFSRCRSAQKPPSMRTSPSPSGSYRPAVRGRTAATVPRPSTPGSVLSVVIVSLSVRRT